MLDSILFRFEQFREQLGRLEHKQDVTLRAIHAILSRETETMGKLHDDLKAAVTAAATAATAVNSSADAVIAVKTETESSMADVLTEVEALQTTLKEIQTKLDTAAADDAASGGSTGGGSGSGTAPVAEHHDAVL